MKNPLVLLLLLVIPLYSSNILDMYDSYTFDETDSVLSSAYTGPLVATGGAVQDMGRYLTTMEPTKIGTIEPNKITLASDPKDEVFTYDSVTYYQVTKCQDTFYVIKINAKKSNENYEILINLKEGPNYDRTLNIYKNGKPYMLVLWVETTRVKQKADRKI